MDDLCPNIYYVTKYISWLSHDSLVCVILSTAKFQLILIQIKHTSFASSLLGYPKALFFVL